MFHLRTLLVVFASAVLLPCVALGATKTPAKNAKSAKATKHKPKGPANQVTVCGTDCPSATHPIKLLQAKKCPDFYSGKSNASLCERNQGDEYLACGELCSMNYSADSSRPVDPSPACARHPGEKGPMVRCIALGAPAPELPMAPAKPAGTPSP